MNEIYSQDLVIGIDAGGTRSRAHLAPAAGAGARAWAGDGGGAGDVVGGGAGAGGGRAGGSGDGAALGRGSGGPGNALSVGRADLTRHLAEAIGEAVRAVPPAARGRVVAAFGGFAGAAAGLGPERGHDLALSCLRDALAAHGVTGAVVAVGGDTEVALASAPGVPADGLVLIAGTGAIATRLTGRRRAAVVDGHGWLLGDEGSGFWLGGRAVRAALEALDGRGPWTSLVPRVLGHYLGEEAARTVRAPGDPDPAPAPVSAPVPAPASAAAAGCWASAAAERRNALGEAVVARAYAQPPVRLALLSPVAVAAAEEGDAVALRLLDEAAGLLAGAVRSLAPRPGEPLVTAGGLLGPDGPLLGRVVGRLAPLGLRIFPVPDGAAGAAALARTLL